LTSGVRVVKLDFRVKQALTALRVDMLEMPAVFDSISIPHLEWIIGDINLFSYGRLSGSDALDIATLRFLYLFSRAL